MAIKYPLTSTERIPASDLLEELRWNAEAERECNSRYEGYTCTRDAGHSGLHVAHGTQEDAVQIWETPK